MVSVQTECDSFCYFETFKKVYIYTHTHIYIYMHIYIHIYIKLSKYTQKSIFTTSVELDEFSERKQHLYSRNPLVDPSGHPRSHH